MFTQHHPLNNHQKEPVRTGVQAPPPSMPILPTAAHAAQPAAGNKLKTSRNSTHLDYQMYRLSAARELQGLDAGSMQVQWRGDAPQDEGASD